MMMKRFTFLSILTLLLAASCAKDAPEAPEGGKVYPYASVSAETGNFPCGGVISTQYADSPYGSDIGKLADNDPSTAFVSRHGQFYVLWSGKKAFSLKSYECIYCILCIAEFFRFFFISRCSDTEQMETISKETVISPVCCPGSYCDH